MGNQNSNIAEGFRIAEPGLLPEEWETISLGEVLEEVDYRVKDSGINDIPVLSMTRYQGLILQNEKFGKRVASRDVNNYKVVRKGYIVYGFPTDEGVIYTLKKVDIGAVSPVYEVWKLSSDIVDIEFLDRLLKTPLMLSTYRRLASTTVERRRIVSKRDFKRIIVSIPPLPEQKAIVRVLSTIQKAVEAQDKIITAARELKKSIMRHLFTYGLVSVAEAEQVPLKETEIGPVPEHWEVVRLGEVAQFKNGINFTKEQKGMGILTVDVLNMYSDSLYPNMQNLYRVSVAPDVEYLLKDGDILFVRSSLKQEGVGWSALSQHYDEPVTFCGFLIRARLTSSNIYPAFLVNFLRLPATRLSLISKSGKLAITNINQGNLKSLPVSVPLIFEQQEIARILETLDAKIETEERQKALLQTLFKTMLHQLMTGTHPHVKVP